MDFSRTEEQNLLFESLAEVVRRVGGEAYIRECEENHKYPVKLSEALHEAGFDYLGVPEEYGGTPCDILTLMMYQEELTRLTGAGYACASSALAVDDMHTFGSPEQFKDTMTAIKNNEHPFCLGFTEPQAGSDNSNISTTFTRKNGKVYINGHKSFITSADKAKFMLCMAKDVNAEPAKAFTTWWVPMNAKGVKVEPLNKLGWHMVQTCEVYLEDVELEEKDLVGKEGYGFLNVMKNFEIERLHVCAIALGEAEMAYEDALEYATQRIQFGQKIGNFQLIQEKLTEMAIKIENMKNLLYKASWLKDQGESINTLAAMTKYYCSRSSFEVVDDAMQIFGGLGYTEDLRIARLWRNSRLHRIGGGTEQIMIHIAGRALQKELKKKA